VVHCTIQQWRLNKQWRAKDGRDGEEDLNRKCISRLSMMTFSEITPYLFLYPDITRFSLLYAVV